MTKAAIVILADIGTHEGVGRVANALEAAKDFKAAKDDVEIIFDGTGTKWVAALSKPDNMFKGLWDSVKEKSKVCTHCAEAFGVSETVKAQGIPFTGEFEGHPSFQKLVSQGFQVITF